MPRRWTNASDHHSGGQRLIALENEMKRLWNIRKQREHERRFGNSRNPFNEIPTEASA